jgi:hypothetical protein
MAHQVAIWSKSPASNERIVFEASREGIHRHAEMRGAVLGGAWTRVNTAPVLRSAEQVLGALETGKETHAYMCALLRAWRAVCEVRGEAREVV